MGRWSYSDRAKADELRQISVYWLKKNGYFHGWKVGSIIWTNSWTGEKNSVLLEGDIHEKVLRLKYTVTHPTREITDHDFKIPLLSTPCYFGGERYWLRCHCGKRVGA